MYNDCEISINVATDYVDDQSDPDIGRYVFAYTITIANQGSVAARLLSRHWVITDGNGKVEEVRGPGVVGEQPILDPGQSFDYTSGCPLTTDVGKMEGSYQMITEDGEMFDAEIAPFTLCQSDTIN